MGGSGSSSRWGRMAGIALAAFSIAGAGSASAERTRYTSQAGYLAALAAGGYERVDEGFEEDGAWGEVRSSVTGGFHAAPSIANRGVTWTSNNGVSGVTTGEGPARTGQWGFYSYPHGNWAEGIGDGWRVTAETPIHGVGGWIDTNTPYAALIFVVDGDESDPVDFEDVVLGSQPRFFGVIDSAGFTTVEVREVEGAIDDQKLLFADDFRFAFPSSGGCVDLDGDGYGSPAAPSCGFPEGDCDDTDPAVNPGAAEIPGNGVDDDCDPSTPAGCNPEVSRGDGAVP